MAFDKNTPHTPLVQPQKKTTQVNIGVIIAVILFFAIAGAVVWMIARNPEETRSDVHQQIESRD